jgi:ubiquinone/menaquinone biosynthesis C-methylase UbiE
MSELDVRSVYSNRFEGQLKFRREMWQALCNDFFQQFFPVDAVVTEIGAGYCEFINAIHAKSKIAVDINPDTDKYADKNVKVIRSTSTNLSEIAAASVDRVFASNFFEHLSREEIIATLKEVRRILKQGGRIIILQPNYRYCYKDYYMFFDHLTALDHRSMPEILSTMGLRAQKIIPQFLPYTTKGKLPSSIFLLRMYLKIPLLWKVLGGQMLIVAVAE